MKDSKSEPVIGSRGRPIRASLLPNLFRCPRFYMEKVLGDKDDVAGEAAQTGNLVHVGIQTFHQSNGNEAQARAMVEASSKVYVSGDVTEALRLLQKYCKRETSERRGIVSRSEEKIEVTLPPSPFDPTKEEIVIQGTVDQIRTIGRDTIYVVDHKTGRKPGADMVMEHATQLAVYMLGVKRMYPDKTVQGFITRIQDLCRADLPYWWPMPFGGTEVEIFNVLQPIIDRIAVIRMQRHHSTPGKHCEWCPLSQYPSCITLPLGHRSKTGSQQIADKVAEKLKPKGKISMSQLFGGK